MKTVVIIGKPTSPLIYFVNSINMCTPIELLVIENRVKKNSIGKGIFKRTMAPRLVERTLRYLLLTKEKFRRKKRQSQLESFNKKFEQELFKGQHKSINNTIPILEVDDINSESSMNAISDINPQLLIDHGTTLVKPYIIEAAHLALNVHWGLSPYYRGIECTEHAIFNYDIHNIGVTVHKLAKKIDGGEILGQSRVEILPNDNLRTINDKLTYEGTKIIMKVIETMKSGGSLTFKNQDFDLGFLFRGIHRHESINAFIADLSEEKMRIIIKNPSRGPAPIVNYT